MKMKMMIALCLSAIFFLGSCGKSDPSVTCHCDRHEDQNLLTYEATAPSCAECSKMNKSYTDQDPFTGDTYTVTIDCYCQ